VTESKRGRGFPLPLERVAGQASSSRTAVLRPQRPLSEAVRDARTLDAPSGVGLDSASVRARMVARLRDDGVRDAGLLQAFQAVPRHLFIETALAAQAYEDTSLPIGHGQTISKPSVVARMIELLLQGAAARARGGLQRVLEIGTGCGYQCALLAQLSHSVVSIERLRPLFDDAREHLAGMRADRVRLIHGDGALGHAPLAPYQSIIAAAVGAELPQAWLEQLDVGGRLVAPVQIDHRQMLAVVDREPSGYKRVHHEEVRFVPLKSGLV
jgi:protein-L-isoaspartate(D-aspartate) O-methyltransferase